MPSSSYACDCGYAMAFSGEARCPSCGRDVDTRKIRKAGLAPGSLKNIGIVPDISMAEKSEADKLDQALVVYMGPSLNNKDFTCGGCVLATPRGFCSVLVPATVNMEHGACCLYVPGSPRQQDLLKIVPQSYVGYEEDGPFTCGRCSNFIAPSTCKGVKSGPQKIDAKGCCDAWDKK